MDTKVNCNNLLNDIVNKKTKKIDFIGKGSYGIVFRGNDEKIGNIAIKFISKKRKYSNDSTHPSNVEYLIGAFLTENILSKNISPHINSIYKENDCKLDKLRNSALISNDKYKSWYNSNMNLIRKKSIYENVKVIYSELATLSFTINL